MISSSSSLPSSFSSSTFIITNHNHHHHHHHHHHHRCHDIIIDELPHHHHHIIIICFPLAFVYLKPVLPIPIKFDYKTTKAKMAMEFVLFRIHAPVTHAFMMQPVSMAIPTRNIFAYAKLATGEKGVKKVQ